MCWSLTNLHFNQSGLELFFVKETLIISIYEYKDVLLVILRQENVHIFALIIVSIEFLVFGVLYYDSYVCVAWMGSMVAQIKMVALVHFLFCVRQDMHKNEWSLTTSALWQFCRSCQNRWLALRLRTHTMEMEKQVSANGFSQLKILYPSNLTVWKRMNIQKGGMSKLNCRFLQVSWKSLSLMSSHIYKR